MRNENWKAPQVKTKTKTKTLMQNEERYSKIVERSTQTLKVKTVRAATRMRMRTRKTKQPN
jgi:hypothetical protein